MPGDLLCAGRGGRPRVLAVQGTRRGLAVRQRGYSVSSQDSQATCAPVVVAHSVSRLVLPKPDGATTSTSGSPADSSLREQGRALHPGPGHTELPALDGHAVVGLDGTPGRPGTRHSPTRRQRQVHPAAGDTWVMPGHHPQPIVGVSATHARTVDVTKCFPGVCRDETPAHARSESVVWRASRRRGAEGSGHDCKDWWCRG